MRKFDPDARAIWAGLWLAAICITRIRPKSKAGRGAMPETALFSSEFAWILHKHSPNTIYRLPLAGPPKSFHEKRSRSEKLSFRDKVGMSSNECLRFFGKPEHGNAPSKKDVARIAWGAGRAPRWPLRPASTRPWGFTARNGLGSEEIAPQARDHGKIRGDAESW